MKIRKFNKLSHDEKINVINKELSGRPNGGEFKYIKSTDKHIILKHSLCGENIPLSERLLSNGSTDVCCRHCVKTGLKYMVNIPEEYKLIKMTVNEANKRHIHLFHTSCGTSFKSRHYSCPEKIVCPVCKDKKYLIERKNNYCNELKLKHNNEFEIVSEYVNMHTPILVKHNSEYCNGTIFEINPWVLLRSGKCKACNEKRNSYEEVNKIVQKYLGEKYLLDKKDFNGREEFYLIHDSDECNHYRFKMNANGIEANRCNCHICGKIMSLGEQQIRTILLNNGVEFEQEKTFADLKYPETNAYPRYDFYIPDNKMGKLIEYDGEFHYHETTKWGISLDEIRRRDAFKNVYAKEKGIPLLRIPYYERENIESLILSFLS